LRPKTKADQEKLLGSEGISVVVPLDCYLGISKLPFKMTAKAMLEVAYWAQNQCSYQAAEDAILKAVGIRVNDDTIRLIVNTVGTMVFKRDCEVAEETYEKLISGKLSFPDAQKTGTLYIEADGAVLNTRKQDENGSTWKESKLGVVFSSDNIHYWKNKKGEKQHRIEKREYTSYIGSVDEFKKLLFACAIRNGYGIYKKTVILSDGATWIRNVKEEMFPDAQQILDYYHLCENVNNYAKQIFSMNEVKYRPWANRICEELKESHHEKVLNELDNISKKQTAQCSFNLGGYIRNNMNNIDYATYIKKGYFIGSGAIESGNKVVLQQRLRQSGMRWNIETAQCLLSLKTKQASHLWHQDVEIPIMRYYDTHTITPVF
jgi:hypothetical protein